MPTYKFQDSNTGEEIIVEMKISERDEFLKNNPHLTQLVHGFPGLGDPIRLGRKKPDEGFRSLLKEVKKRNRGSTINTHW